MHTSQTHLAIDFSHITVCHLLFLATSGTYELILAAATYRSRARRDIRLTQRHNPQFGESSFLHGSQLDKVLGTTMGQYTSMNSHSSHLPHATHFTPPTQIGKPRPHFFNQYCSFLDQKEAFDANKGRFTENQNQVVSNDKRGQPFLQPRRKFDITRAFRGGWSK